jgi:hypothetical protein
VKYVKSGRRRHDKRGRTKDGRARMNMEVMWFVFSIETGSVIMNEVLQGVVKVTQENGSWKDDRHNMLQTLVLLNFQYGPLSMTYRLNKILRISYVA